MRVCMCTFLALAFSTYNVHTEKPWQTFLNKIIEVGSTPTNTGLEFHFIHHKNKNVALKTVQL